jgi:CheY-like chemotaxis protein
LIAASRGQYRARTGMPRPKILLVDDNQELLTLLARLVETEGWEAVTATKGKAALDQLAAAVPAAAVVDVLLPDMMGYDVASALRTAKVPFVFMTGVFKGARAANDAKGQHGAAAYFEKPFEARKLVEALRALFPREAPRPAAAPAPAPAPKPPPVPGRAPATAPPPTPPPVPTRTAPSRPADPEASDFDVEVAVEAEEDVEAMELTGRVVVTGDGRVSAVLRGEDLAAAPVATPSRPFPAGKVPPATATSPATSPAAAPTAAPARAAPRPAADLGRPEGKLDENLPDLITAFHLAQQTGELTLQKGKVKKTIFFEKGRPCFAISNLSNDRFGPFLVRVGKLTPPQLDELQAAAARDGRRVDDVVVERGVLKEPERLYYLAQQVKAIVYSVFGWEEGDYRLHFDGRAAREALKVDLHPANLIVRGVKKLYKPERLQRLLRPEDHLVPTQQPAYGLHEVELERWEAEILPSVDGTRAVAEVVHLAKRPPHVVHAFLYAMLALKLVDRA